MGTEKAAEVGRVTRRMLYRGQGAGDRCSVGRTGCESGGLTAHYEAVDENILFYFFLVRAFKE